MVILFGGPFRVNSPGHVAEHNRLATAVPEGGDDTTFLRGDGTWQPGTVSDAGVAALIPDTGTATGAALAEAIGANVGMVGKPTGSDDTTLIQSLLTDARNAGGGRIIGSPGATYKVAGELVIGSGTIFDMSGCTLKKPSGSTTRMIHNWSDLNPVATGTASTILGSNVITTALASSAAVGQSIVVQGAGGNGNGPLVGLISAVGAGTVTVVALDGRVENATAAVSASVAVLYNRDANITVRLGKMDMSDVIGGGTATYGNVYFRHADNVEVSVNNYVSTNTGRGIGVGDVRNIRIRMDDCTTPGVGVQVSGPADNVDIVHVMGSTGDDLLAFTAGDYDHQQATAGNITNVAVGKVYARGSSLNTFKLIAGAGRFLGGVKVAAGISGKSTANGVWIGDDTGEPSTTGGVYGDIDLGTVSVFSTSWQISLASPVVDTIRARIIMSPGVPPTHVSVSAGGHSTNTIGNLILSGDLSLQSQGIMALSNAATTINNLVIENMVIATDGTSSVFNGVNFTAAATVRNMTFRNVQCRVSGTTQYLVLAASGAINNLLVEDGFYVGGNSFAKLTLAEPVNVTLRRANFSGMGRVLNLYSAATIILDDPVISTSNTPVYLAGAALTIQGASSSPVPVQRLASEALRYNGLTLRVDVSTLTAADGDAAFNTNSSLGCGVGPAIYNSTAGKWKGLYSGTTT